MQIRPKMTLEQYAALLADEVGAPLTTEQLPIRCCLGRVLASDQTALAAIPPFTNSAMDGFAVRQADGCPLPIAFDIFAGDSPAPLPPGHAARIMTGAPIPAGADTVVPIEDCDERDQLVSFTAPVRLGQHIRHVGEDLRPGDPVLSSGTTLLPQHLASAASAGLTALTVVVPPTVAVVVTGDEVVADGQTKLGARRSIAVPSEDALDGMSCNPISSTCSGSTPLDMGAADRPSSVPQPVHEYFATLPSHIPDSNGPYLAAAIAGIGACPIMMFSPDDPSALQAALDEAARQAQLIIVTGGASAGDRDVARDVLSDAGCQFVHVAMQPGKPQGHGTWQGVPVFALPGNPVSVAVSWTMLIRPAINAWLGCTPAPTRWGIATQGWTTPDGRCQLMPVALSYDEDGRTLVRPAAALGSGSHLIGSLARAQALAVVPAEVERVQAGDALRIVDLN